SGYTARLSRHRATAVDRNGLAGADRHGAGEDGKLSRVVRAALALGARPVARRRLQQQRRRGRQLEHRLQQRGPVAQRRVPPDAASRRVLSDRELGLETQPLGPSGPRRSLRIQAPRRDLSIVRRSARRRPGTARYGNSRSGERLHLAAGLALPLGLTARGDIAWANDLEAPALASDTAQRTTDVSGALRWDRHRVSVEVGLARRDSFVPLGRPT